jgi:hypothetical protein
MARIFSLAIASAITGAGIAPVHAATSGEVDCSAALQIARNAAPQGPVTAGDLVGLIDLGTIPDLADDSFFSLSPDGRTIAISVRRAIADTNSYCTGIYIGPLGGPVRLVDSGTDTIFWRFPVIIGKADFPSGFPKVITPRWSPDGRSLAFLKPVGGIAQVWMVDPDGTDDRQVTRMKTDVLDFRYRDGGQAIVVRTEDGEEPRKRLLTEALQGFHYDDRFSPMASARPFLRGPLPTRLSVVTIDNGKIGPATSEDARSFASVSAEKKLRAGWTPVDDDMSDDEHGVAAMDRFRHVVRCRDTLCQGTIGRPWMSADGTEIRFVRKEGWALNRMSIYGWKVSAPRPRRLFSTSDLLLDCTPTDDEVICAREGSTRPRYLSRIDFHTGRSASIFDPNPDFATRRLGKVKRLMWRNHFGVETFGDLVYPVGYQSNRAYPLIVVQYTSRGFLRGGTGDEFPVQLFADHGFLVLNIQHPLSPIRFPPGTSVDEQARLDLKGLVDRRSILSSFETIVRRLISDGIADPKRIGITGLSDGASTVQFAMLHSRLFKVASISSCCWEPSQAWTLGPAIQRYYQSIGWPSVTGNHRSFWAQISLARNTDRVTMPLLIQASDDEYQIALESYTALRERHHPIDLYVFPGEHHVKRQPAHRLAIYQRNLDWFSFWLKDEVPRYAPDHGAEYQRWNAMRSMARPPHPLRFTPSARARVALRRTDSG